MAQELQDFQKRVVEEKQQLDDRISALTQFIDHSEVFKKVDSDEQSRLRRQLEIMLQLSSVLGARIHAFK